MTSQRKYIVATRPSLLAYTQTKQIVDLLKKENPGCEFEIIKYSTKGDRVADRSLTEFGGTGIFVKELENAILDKRADFAVHSLKDVPNDLPKDLILAAYPQRINPHDIFLTNDGTDLKGIKEGFVVGTGSPRRRIQIFNLRADASFMDIRGNIDTRIKKLDEGKYDAIILAAAGLIRLGKVFPDNAELSFEECIPAIGQGAIALECRIDDNEAIEVLRKINHPETEIAVTAERVFMRAIGGGCKFPMAAYGAIENDIITLYVIAGDLGSGKYVRMTDKSSVSEANIMAGKLANRLKAACLEGNIDLYSSFNV
ncbi:MAG: hydroxymethylbilane synthase [Bacteroidota bacterium]